MKNVYLVDCENVGKDNLIVNSDSTVYYFTSNHMKKMKLSDTEQEIHIEHNREKNALDNVILVSLGILICRYGNEVTYHIISKDKGYDFICNFLTESGYTIKRHDSFYNEKDCAEKMHFVNCADNITATFTKEDSDFVAKTYRDWINTAFCVVDDLQNQIDGYFKDKLSNLDRKILVGYLAEYR